MCDSNQTVDEERDEVQKTADEVIESATLADNTIVSEMEINDKVMTSIDELKKQLAVMYVNCVRWRNFILIWRYKKTNLKEDIEQWLGLDEKYLFNDYSVYSLVYELIDF